MVGFGISGDKLEQLARKNWMDELKNAAAVKERKQRSQSARGRD